MAQFNKKTLAKGAGALALVAALSFSKDAKAGGMTCSTEDPNTGELVKVECPTGGGGDVTTQVRTGDVTTGDVTTGDVTTQVRTGDTNVKTGDTNVRTGDVNTQVRTGDVETHGGAGGDGGNVHFENKSTYKAGAALNFSGASGYAAVNNSAKRECEAAGFSFNVMGGNVYAGYGGFGLSLGDDELVNITVPKLDENGDVVKKKNGDVQMITYLPSALYEMSATELGDVINSLPSAEEQEKGYCFVKAHEREKINFERQAKLKNAELKAGLIRTQIVENGKTQRSHIDGHYMVANQKAKQSGETARKVLTHACNEAVSYKEVPAYTKITVNVEQFKLDDKGNKIPDTATPGEFLKETVEKEKTVPLKNKDGSVVMQKIPVPDTVASHKRHSNGRLDGKNPVISEHGACAKAVDETLKGLTNAVKDAAATAPYKVQEIKVDFDLGL